MRAAVIDAAGRLFALRGVRAVTLRDIAAEADVQLGLIPRHFGSREGLINAVFEDLTERVAADLRDRPLEGHSFDADSTAGRWTALLVYYAVERETPPTVGTFNPVEALAAVLETAYGHDRAAAHRRAAQLLASALGWRVFEDQLIAWGGFPEEERAVMRADLTALHRRMGATPWPSPPDPPRRGS